MIWNIQDAQEWHRWFAWHPVTLWTGDRRVWLRIVSRRRVVGYGWEYTE